MNPIRLISTTFADILTDLANDSRTADAPYFLRLMIAGIFTVLNIRLNVSINQTLISTMTDRTIAEDVLALQDYRLNGKNPASVVVTVTVDAAKTLSGPYTIDVADLMAETAGTTSSPALHFEARESLTIPISTSTGDVTMYHQTTKPQTRIGITENDVRIFRLPDLDVIRETLTLSIGGTIYYPAGVYFDRADDTLAYATASDPVFVHKTLSDGSSYIILGFVDEIDGDQYGQIPDAGLDILATYAVGGGSVGNTATAGLISVYVGADAGVTGITNAADATGGANQESLANAKRIAPLLSRTHDMFWDVDSGKAIAQSISGVLKAQIVVTGILEASAYVMPAGGGAASPALLASVTASLTNASAFEQVTLNGGTGAESVNYVSQTLSLSAKMKVGSSYTTILPYIKLAAVLRASEIAFYIQDVYNEDGLSAAIDIINTDLYALVGTTFTVDKDGAQIRRLLENLNTQDFGDSFGPSDLASAIQGFVFGVDYITVTQPASRVSVSDSQIIQPTSITVTQII